MQLPEDFIRITRETMGEERFQQFLESFNEDVPVSIRLNPLKTIEATIVDCGEPVGWCRGSYYLSHRPNFTMDPLLHAGCYYVQEAASMFLDEALRQHLPLQPLAALDLCAAPGGKSTLLAAALPEGSTLYSNEPVRQRASILLENITKWGFPGSIVTNNYPRDYRASKLRFDVILCDVPCSGEGMFRKDPATIGEWSSQNVERCSQLQRNIAGDAWQCLNDGGLMIYSTCTFNTKENEENVSWICDELGAEVLPVETLAAWNITGSLLPSFTKPVYRFIPGITRSEGLFLCVLRKRGEGGMLKNKGRNTGRQKSPLTILPSPVARHPSPQAALTYPQAIAYLRGEALQLPPDTPRGIVEVTFQGHVLGTVKNIGSRANNQYPKEWRIKTTHVPQEYEPIILPR